MATSLLKTETVKYGDIEIALETSTLLSDMEASEVAEMLDKALTAHKGYINTYARVVSQSRKTKGLGFDLPAPSADESSHLAAYQQFIRLPTALITALMQAAGIVNKAPGAKADASDPKASGESESSSATG